MGGFAVDHRTGKPYMQVMVSLPSITKLLVLGLILLVVWSFLKVRRKPVMPDQQADRRQRPGSKDMVQDMNFCPVCGVYVAGNTSPCGRDNCPVGRG